MKRMLVEQNGMKLEYLVFGDGPDVLLCFHGFGRRAEDFLYFREVLEKRYTVYSFNMFHHGRSEYPGDRIAENTLRPEELQGIMELFLQQHNISGFSMMGYSMGGKISLALLQLMPERIEGIYLMAPDGIVPNQWYRFTSKSKVGNKIYRWILRSPGVFFGILNALRFLRLISEKFSRFVKGNLDTRQKRELVYKVWMTLRSIDPSPSRSAAIIAANSIPLILIYGKYDRIIKPRGGKKFAERSGSSVRFFEAECGHNLFNPDAFRILQEHLIPEKVQE